MRHTLPLRRWISALAVLLVTACAATAPPPDPPPPPPLFERLGGIVGVTAVVDDFMGTVVADKRIAAYFRKTELPRLKPGLRDQLCAAIGGPCVYAGKPMAAAHKGLGVTEAAFDAFIDDLQKTLNKAHFAAQDQAELLAILYAMQDDVVQPLPPATQAAQPKAAHKPAPMTP